MRFHSLILSAIFDIPFLAISYGQKTEELLKDFSYEYKLNPKTFEFEEFIKVFESLEKDTDSAKFALKTKKDIIKSEILNNYNQFFDGLESIKR